MDSLTGLSKIIHCEVMYLNYRGALVKEELIDFWIEINFSYSIIGRNCEINNKEQY